MSAHDPQPEPVKHPGRRLAEDYLAPLDIRPAQLARALGVHRSTISRLLRGKSRMTPALAARLGAFFQVPARWFLVHQLEWEEGQVDAEVVAGEVEPFAERSSTLITRRSATRLRAADTPAPKAALATVSAEFEARLRAAAAALDDGTAPELELVVVDYGGGYRGVESRRAVPPGTEDAT